MRWVFGERASSCWIGVSGGLLLAMLALAFAFVAPAAADDRYDDRATEQELVDRFAPIVMVRTLQERCTTRGEQFQPVPVETIFGSPDVRLMKRGENGAPDQVIKTAPVAQDLAGLDSSYYLDLPGNPRDPRCTYEHWNDQRIHALGLEPSIYGRVVTEDGQDGIVVQYWFYWVFNLFNDTHESDWEGIQLHFAASSMEEILENNLQPDSVAFAQHGGGEWGDWDDDKVEREGDRIVVHPSSGSHASYFNATTWLGWGENGSGFGCDLTDDPYHELPVTVILMPDEIDPKGDFAWLTYTGYWGEHEAGVFNGPQGPNTKPRWDQPITWADGIRQSSLPIPMHQTIGPSPSGVFCTGAQVGSRFVQYFSVDPKIVSGIVIALLGAITVLAVMAWRYLARAIELYVRHAYLYLIFGAATVPVAALSAKVESAVERWVRSELVASPASDRVEALFWEVLGFWASGIQEFLMLSLLAPPVIYVTYHLVRNDAIHMRMRWKQGVLHVPAIFLASLMNSVMIFAMAITVILLPWVIYKGVRWFFVGQAIIIDGSDAGTARHVSERAVKGHWHTALAIVLWIAIVTRLPGPLIGTAAMVVGGVTINSAEWISGIIYCLIFPIGIIASTLFYCDIQGKLGERIDETNLPPQDNPLVAPAAI